MTARRVNRAASDSATFAAAPPSFARIPAGAFLMGASDADDDQRPIHQVQVSEFFIGRFPVTQDEYARFIRATGYDPPAVRELPLIAGGGRQAMFKELAARYARRSEQQTPALHSH